MVLLTITFIQKFYTVICRQNGPKLTSLYEDLSFFLRTSVIEPWLVIGRDRLRLIVLWWLVSTSTPY